MNINDLKFDRHNANLGTDRGRAALAASLKQYGAGRSILVDKKGRVIAGNKTLEQALAAGYQDVLVVKTDGKKLVVVQRTDLDLTDPKARALAVADNRVGELNLEWDPKVLADLHCEINLDAFFTTRERTEIFSALFPEEIPEKAPVEFVHVCPKCGHKFSGKRSVNKAAKALAEKVPVRRLRRRKA